MAASPIKSFGIKDLLGISDNGSNPPAPRNIQSEFLSPTKPLNLKVVDNLLNLPVSVAGLLVESLKNLDADSSNMHSIFNLLNLQNLLQGSFSGQSFNNFMPDSSSGLISGVNPGLDPQKSISDLTALMGLFQRDIPSNNSSNFLPNINMGLHSQPLPAPFVPNVPTSISNQIASNHQVNYII